MTGTDLATDVSRRTDRTSYSIPEDGSPITIPTKRKKDKRDKEHHSTLIRGAHQSQTSLLIEYFEGGKGTSVHSRPSVRVKVTPSGARKAKDSNEHIQITEAGGNRKPSYTRRISLGPKIAGERQVGESADDRSLSSHTSAAEESSLAGRYPPVEIEFMHRDQSSDISTASAAKQQQYIQQNPSEISSMPPDSMLEGNAGNTTPRRDRSRSLSRDAVITTSNTLKTPSRRRSRSLSRERLTQKVIEKLGNSPRDMGREKRKHGSKARSRSVSVDHNVESVKSPRRRSGKHHHEEDFTDGVESSVFTTSQLSSRRKSGDQYSIRSGTSKSSINNPKLLETVEDAIRRLILPELVTLKHEQKIQHNRNNFERDKRESVKSGGMSSGGEITRRVSKHASAPDVSIKPKVVLNQDEHNAGTVLSGNSIKGKKDNGHYRNIDSPSERSFEREMSEETVIRSEVKEPRRRSKDGHRLQDDPTTGISGELLTSAALMHHDSRSSVERRERKRRRSKSHSRSASIVESTEDIFNKHDVPPMPMRSEIYGSEVTRDSLLSERTEEPYSPSERRRTRIREVSRGSPQEVISPATRTPTRTPLNLRKGLGTHHSNLSRGDLSIHSAHSNTSLPDQKHRSMSGEVAFAEAETGSDHSVDHNKNVEEFNEYAAHPSRSRGLSPVQSVTSFREENGLINQDSLRQTPSSGSPSSLDQQHGKTSGLSINSLSSVPSTKNARSNRPKGINLENGQDVLDQHTTRALGLVEADMSPDPAMDDWYEQQHEQNDRYRESYENSSMMDSVIDVRHLTNYTDDSLDAPYLDKITAAHQIQGLGANPEYVRTPVAVESAVASLLDPSVVSERSKIGNKSLVDSVEDHQLAASNGQETPHDGAAAHEISKTRGQGSIINSPRQSVAQSLADREESVVLGATGLPVADDPMPEPGYGLDSDSDLNTNPSVIQGPLILGARQDGHNNWPYQSTSPQSKGEHLNLSNEHSAQASLKAAAEGMLNAAAVAQRNQGYQITHDRTKDLSLDENNPPSAEEAYTHSGNRSFGQAEETYMSNRPFPTPPTAKLDEGYISAPHAGFSPEPKYMKADEYSNEGMNDVDDLLADDDPFINKARTKHLSANSHGMPSPLYDSATGGGIDRIQSKDIVALMDHVRELSPDKQDFILTWA